MNIHPPKDYLEPEWSVDNPVHNWRNYISTDIKELWSTFDSAQKSAIARQARDQASEEDWD